MNSSTRIGESGARPHRKGGDRIPLGNKILMFVLSIGVRECYIINSMRSSKMRIVCVCIYSVVCDIYYRN